jgi:ribonuclease-3
LVALQDILGISFNNLSLLEQALVHSSYINENPDLAQASNERLEFLGDAILGLVIAEELYQTLPNAAEGEMTKLRATLVSRNTLAQLAGAIKLGDYLYLGKGEESSGGRHKTSNLAGALEALIAAISLDQGLAATKSFILRLFEQELEKLVSQGTEVNYKSRLQELIQARGEPPPVYYVIETKGPDHDRRFTVEVRAGNTALGRGTGRSKKSAETEAARSALENL